nr:ROK family transcriptional regulator [Galbitalea soli]
MQDAQRSVLLDLLVHGSRSRAELARRTGLSRPTLTRLTRGLIDLGLVAEGEILPLPGRGRPSEMLELRPGAAHFLGVLLAGDTVRAAVTDLSGTVVHREQHRLDSRDLTALATLLTRVSVRLTPQFNRLSALGVCVIGEAPRPDPMGDDRHSLRDALRQATRLPSAIRSPVQALASAHHWFGAGLGRSSLALLDVGGGIDCGLVLRDEVIEGSRGQAGRVGHLAVDTTGPRCDRGHAGCVAAYATARSLVAGSGMPDASVATVVAAAREGDQRALAAVRLAGTALGVAIAHIVNLLDVEVVIVAGLGGAVVDLARDEVGAAIDSRRDPPGAAPPLVVSAPGPVDYARAAAMSAVRLVV